MNSNLFKLLNELYKDDKKSFHFKTSNLLEKVINKDIIYESVYTNLKNPNFLCKKWHCYEIPSFKLFSNEFVDLDINVFTPSVDSNTKSAYSMIHNHLNNKLTSYVFYGPGYQTITFDDKVKNLKNNIVELKIKDDFFHSNCNMYTLNCYQPHITFNVSKPTFTVALWTKEKEKSNHNNVSRNYYFLDGKFFSISDIKFKEKLSNVFFEYNYHIHSLCYFIQEIGYFNRNFFSEIIQNKNIPESWRFYLLKIANGSRISIPLYEYKYNFPFGVIEYHNVAKYAK